ncbi:hypothetical protein [Armatimonas sp.]|uniref:hypothetical protein n=1 Tax=Armatimonas sp. TaxID=1872638 RepID=UPI00286CD215|nr:hypothetical protein [Armatimonas sp.]
MSRIVHRQPSWTWSLFVLSTLLLTPSTAAVVLAALRQANLSTATAPAPASVSPRRATTEEEQAIKAAAQSGRLKVVRLEPAADRSTLAILTPTRITVGLPELRVAPQTWALVRTHFLAPVLPSGGSRAPPLG